MSVFSVPVTIGVDEEAIAKNIEKDVEKQIVEKIRKEVEGAIYGRYGSLSTYAYEYESPIKSMIRGEVANIIEQDREKIIKLASELLADKLVRTKAVKEAAGKTAKEVYEPAWVKAKKEKEAKE